jgi:hypothetical protein
MRWLQLCERRSLSFHDHRTTPIIEWNPFQMTGSNGCIRQPSRQEWRHRSMNGATEASRDVLIMLIDLAKYSITMGHSFFSALKSTSSPCCFLSGRTYHTYERTRYQLLPTLIRPKFYSSNVCTLSINAINFPQILILVNQTVSAS